MNKITSANTRFASGGLTREYIKMISGYSDLILSESNKSWNDINFKQTEPQIIKEYLLTSRKGVDYLNRNISEIITKETGYEMKFASVYCHKKPTISRTENSINQCQGNTPGCELGDLMTIFLLLDRDKSIAFSSAKIMQAKTKDVLDSKSQKCLYESDKDFEMPQNILDKSTCNNKLRKMPDYSENRNSGLSYLILNNGYPFNKEIPSASNLHYSWGHHLQLTMELKTGKEFTIPTDEKDNGWNCIINDLLNIGSGSVKSSTERGYGIKELINAFNFFFYYPEYWIENEETGIPKLLVICRDTERRIEN